MKEMSLSAKIRSALMSALLTSLSRMQVMLAKALVKVPKPPSHLHPQRILIIQIYDTLGDVICASPLVREISRQYPGVEISVAVSSHGIPGILNENPYISDIIPVDVDCRKWIRPILLPWRHWRFAKRVLRPRHFDTVIIPRYFIDSSYVTFLAYFSGAPCRIGYSEEVTAHRRTLNRGYDQLLTTALPAVASGTNEVSLNVNVLSAFNKTAIEEKPELWISNADRNFAINALSRLSRVKVCISPTSGHSKLKQWGEDKFARLASELSKHGYDIVLIGSPQDSIMAKSIEAQVAGLCVNLAGETSIREMAAVISMCDLYIGNDAGPAHVASAMDIPSLTIFGSSCHHQFAPWGSANRVLTVELECSPCKKGHRIDRCQTCIYEEPKCMSMISVEDVMRAAQSMLQN